MSSSTLKDLRSVPIFELSDEQLRERLRPAYEKIKQEAFAKNSYLTYFDPLVCPTNAHAVHEYRDRKELIWMDHTGKEHFVKTL
ncbi:hypothetical protein Q3A68_18265 [Mucilaginibacter sp. BT774]|nr:hypothetical protein [Mucilaginibacter sp. BT774]